MRRCPNCNANNEDETSITGAGQTPEPGNIAICLHCQVVSIFDEDLQLRFPTQQDVDELRKHEIWSKIHECRWIIKENFEFPLVPDLSELARSLRLCDKETIEGLIVIHYGNSEYIPNKMKQIINCFIKPIGGLWASPVDAGWGWKHWCDSNQFADCKEENSFRLKFNSSARIIRIDSYEDLKKLPAYDPFKEMQKKIPFIPTMKSLDFELLAKVCDVIWLTEKGEEQTRFSHPETLYGWDCESVLIMNPKCCYQI